MNWFRRLFTAADDESLCAKINETPFHPAFTVQGGQGNLS